MSQEVLKEIDFILKVNKQVAESVGTGYFFYLQVIFDSLIKLYNFYSSFVSQYVN